MDRDEACGALGLERAEPLLHLRGLQAEPAVTGQLDCDEIAVLRVGGCTGRDRQLTAELLLVDRLQPPAAVRQQAKHAKLALPGAVQDLDDAAGVADRAFLGDFFRAQQRAVADTWNFDRARLARNMDANARRLAVLLGVPFGRNGDQLAIAVAFGDVG